MQFERLVGRFEKTNAMQERKGGSIETNGFHMWMRWSVQGNASLFTGPSYDERPKNGQYKCEHLHSSLKSDSDGSRAAPLPPAVWDWADITVSDGQWGEGKCLLVTATS